LESVDRKAKAASDLGVRTASAIVMLVVAGAAIWIGGNVFNILAAVVGVAVLSEWIGLAIKFAKSRAGRSIWILVGVIYIGVGIFALTFVNGDFGSIGLLEMIGAVVATDIGAYFAGRSIGGPKIAPRISPSKTWSGLCGGMLLASAFLGYAQYFISAHDLATLRGEMTSDGSLCSFRESCVVHFELKPFIAGAVVAIVAQAGDFFESWMKRRAGVKDSSSLIPGHGGVFDRVDGLLAVLFVFGMFVIHRFYLP
jgi:phosphatidate cytidylyltransferase